MTWAELPKGHPSSWPIALLPQRTAWHEWPLTPFSGLCELLDLKQSLQQVTQNVFQELPFPDECRQPVPVFLEISYSFSHIGICAELGNTILASINMIATVHQPSRSLGCIGFVASAGLQQGYQERLHETYPHFMRPRPRFSVVSDTAVRQINRENRRSLAEAK
jgi:hypothetical protein